MLIYSIIYNNYNLLIITNTMDGEVVKRDRVLYQ